MSTTKKEITYEQLQKKFKKNPEIIQITKDLLKANLNYSIIKNSFLQLGKYLDSFEIENEDTEGTIGVYEKLQAEQNIIYEKLLEYSEIVDNLYDDLSEVKEEIRNKYKIVRHSIPIMHISKNARGNKTRNKNKANKRKLRLKTKKRAGVLPALSSTVEKLMSKKFNEMDYDEPGINILLANTVKEKNIEILALKDLYALLDVQKGMQHIGTRNRGVTPDKIYDIILNIVTNLEKKRVEKISDKLINPKTREFAKKDKWTQNDIDYYFQIIKDKIQELKEELDEFDD